MDYDYRYLGGILFFNTRDFFEAHEVWEDLWLSTAGPERRFFQGLIQAAVALYHFGNGNLRGAVKLFHSARDYMKPFGSPYLGLDTEAFWRQMEECFAEVLAATDLSALPLQKGGQEATPPLQKGGQGGVPLREERIPMITLAPPPTTWPNPADFAEAED